MKLKTDFKVITIPDIDHLSMHMANWAINILLKQKTGYFINSCDRSSSITYIVCTFW